MNTNYNSFLKETYKFLLEKLNYYKIDCFQFQYTAHYC